MRFNLRILLFLVLAAVSPARATVSFDMAIDRLDDNNGVPVASGSLVVLVADTNGDGLGTAIAGSLALQTPLDGAGGDDLIIYRSDLSGFGGGGTLAVSTGGLDLGGVGAGQWSAGDPVYLVWFPNLTLADGSLSIGEPYGARAIGVTPSDGGNELLAYVAPTNTGSFGSAPIPSNATDLRSSLTSSILIDPPVVGSPTMTSITQTGATLGGTVVSDGGDSVTERGVVYALVSANPEPEIGGSGVSMSATGGGLGVFSVPVAGLTGGSTYAFRAFATNGGGSGYSASAVFTTDTTLTLVGGLASIARDLYPGDTHRFFFTVDGPRYLNLSTGGVPLRARLFNSLGQLIAEQSVEGAVSFANLFLTSGNYTLEIIRDAGAGAGSPYTMTVDASTVAFPKPDAAVGASLTSLTGTDVYYPTTQQLVLASRDARTVSGYVTLTNRGNVTDRVSLQGTAGNNDFAVGYFDEAGSNVTAQVLVGSFQTPDMVPLAPARWVRAAITPTKRAVQLRRSYSLSINARSQFDSAVRDAVSILINTR